LSTSKGNLEAIILTFIAKVSYFHICNRGNFHANVTGDHRSDGANYEGKKSVGELAVVVRVFPVLVNSGKNNEREHANKDD